jgi:hypothetical protein
MIFSPAQREATPASANNFCSRNFKISRGEGAIKLDFWFGFAQTNDTVASLPLLSFLERFHSFKSFHDIALGTHSNRRAQTAML